MEGGSGCSRALGGRNDDKGAKVCRKAMDKKKKGKKEKR